MNYNVVLLKNLKVGRKMKTIKSIQQLLDNNKVDMVVLEILENEFLKVYCNICRKEFTETITAFLNTLNCSNH